MDIVQESSKHDQKKETLTASNSQLEFLISPIKYLVTDSVRFFFSKKKTISAIISDYIELNSNVMTAWLHVNLMNSKWQLECAP